jgi:hypothetical protein
MRRRTLHTWKFAHLLQLIHEERDNIHLLLRALKTAFMWVIFWRQRFIDSHSAKERAH